MIGQSQVAQHLRRLDSFKTKRQPLEKHWADCFAYTFPVRAHGLNGLKLDAASIEAQHARILHGVGTDSGRVLASGLVSGLTPANSMWAELDVNGATDEEKRWLSESSKLLWENIHATNFDAANFECMLDIVGAGWFALFVDEDKDEGGFTFEQWPIAGLYCGASKRGGQIDIIYRPYQLTAEQALKEFGNELSPEVIKLATDKPDEMVDFVHCIHPRETYVVNAALSKNLPIASVHIELKAKRPVRESGYHEMPVIVPRWELIPDSVYAIGQTSAALPDIRELNEIRRLELGSLDLAVAGMWIAQDDGVLNPRTVKVGARKIIVANSVDSMKELKSGADFNVAFSAEERLERQIRKIMLADQLQPQDGPAMTATEVHARIALIRQLLGPIYGRLQSEYLQPLIKRCFGIAFRAGIFETPPQSLVNRSYTVKYISPLARAQKLEEVSAIDQHVAGAMQVAQAKPDVLDNIDFDEALRYRGEALGVPAKVQRNAEDVVALRQAREQQQQEAAQQQQMQPMIDSAGKAIGQRIAGAA